MARRVRSEEERSGREEREGHYLETIRLPDMEPVDDYVRSIVFPDKKKPPKPGRDRWLKPGVYDAHGKWVGDLHNYEDSEEEPRLFIEFAGVNFVWGTFKHRLYAHHRGTMRFENVPGTGPITPFFGEWDPVANVPRIGQAVFTLIVAQRGRGTALISGENTSSADLPAAAGFIVSQTVGMPEDD